jgi:hypothetical protein
VNNLDDKVEDISDEGIPLRSGTGPLHEPGIEGVERAIYKEVSQIVGSERDSKDPLLECYLDAYLNRFETKSIDLLGFEALLRRLFRRYGVDAIRIGTHRRVIHFLLRNLDQKTLDTNFVKEVFMLIFARYNIVTIRKDISTLCREHDLPMNIFFELVGNMAFADPKGFPLISKKES